MPLSQSSRDWLIAFALAGMLLRASLLVWAAPLMTASDFMLFCSSQGAQWLDVSDEDDSGHTLCAQCATQASTLPVWSYLPPSPPMLDSPAARLQDQLLRWYPPFLLAPPNRAPPTHA